MTADQAKDASEPGSVLVLIENCVEVTLETQYFDAFPMLFVAVTDMSCAPGVCDNP